MTAAMKQSIKMPSSPEAEGALLGALLLDGQAAKTRLRELNPSLFFNDNHKAILKALKHISNKGDEISEHTLLLHHNRSEIAMAEAGGISIVADLVNQCPSAISYPYWLAELKEYSSRREIIRLAEKTMVLAMETAQDPSTLSGQFADSCKSLMRQAGPQKERFRFYSPSECRSYEPPEGHVLVGDCHIVRGNITVLSGAPGTGKSRAATYLAIAGAIKVDWFGLPVHSRFKTAILQAENGRYRLKTELNHITDSSLDDFIRISEPPPCGMAFGDMAFRDDLRDWMAGFEPDLVVLDPWNAITGDDSQRDYREALNNVREAMPKGDIEPAILIVAHNRKPKNDERKTGRALLNEVAGSHVIGSAARCVFIMQAASDDEEDNRVVLNCAKNNDGALPAQSAWHRKNGIFLRCEDFDWEEFNKPSNSNSSPISIEALRTLFDSGKRQLEKNRTVDELMVVTGKGKSSCYNALNVEFGKFSEYLEEKGGLIEWRGK
ncbi:MAG TPA: hypothetical protein EYN71_03815 [Flavobacteriales bacterium]|nr:hypothetical protein [Flavobacteriales bacterium]